MRHTAHFLNFVDQITGFCDQACRQALHIVAARQRVNDLGDTRFFLQDKLCVSSYPRREFAREGHRLVEGIGVQRLGATKPRSQRLDRGADDVVVRILLSKRDARRLTMGAQHQRLIILWLEAVTHQVRPQEPRRPKFSHFHKKVHPNAEEEGQTRRELVHVETLRLRGADIFQSISDSVGEFLHAGRTRFLHVIPGDRDRVVPGHIFRRVCDNIGDNAHRWFRRIDIGVADHKLL